MRRAKLQLYEGKILAEVGKGQPKFKKVPQEQIGTMTGKQIISEIEGLFGIKVEMGSADAKKWLDIECDNYAANKKTKEDLASGAIVDNHNGRMKAVFDEEVAHS
ncbi:MAG: hypothetical protein NT051_04365, partial [Candidatus Micrarchaeota archaeon]|nr:hypothetical protein [Candidatus Micrarchaeota archaeon]